MSRIHSIANNKSRNITISKVTRDRHLAGAKFTSTSHSNSAYVFFYYCFIPGWQFSPLKLQYLNRMSGTLYPVIMSNTPSLLVDLLLVLFKSSTHIKLIPASIKHITKIPKINQLWRVKSNWTQSRCSQSPPLIKRVVLVYPFSSVQTIFICPTCHAFFR